MWKPEGWIDGRHGGMSRWTVSNVLIGVRLDVVSHKQSKRYLRGALGPPQSGIPAAATTSHH